MEILDIYDEHMNKIGSEKRDIVHQNGMWHKTIHCWIYDEMGNIYFQIRKDSGKLYTTASGHILAGESIQDAFKREIHEEIGIDTDVSNAIALEVIYWRQDKPQKNWHDRAFAHIYLSKIPFGFTNFKFQPEEVTGIIRINAKDCMDLLTNKKTSIPATKITKDKSIDVEITNNDLLTASDETAIIKYGYVVQCVIQQTK